MGIGRKRSSGPSEEGPAAASSLAAGGHRHHRRAGTVSCAGGLLNFQTWELWTSISDQKRNQSEIFRSTSPKQTLRDWVVFPLQNPPAIFGVLVGFKIHQFSTESQDPKMFVSAEAFRRSRRRGVDPENARLMPQEPCSRSWFLHNILRIRLRLGFTIIR